MLKDYDIVALESGGYELVSGHATFSVSFDDSDDKEMFDTLVAYRDKSPREIIRRLGKRRDKQAVLSFLGKLRSAGLIIYETEQDLDAGRVYEKSESLSFSVDAAAAKRIVIVSASPFATILKNFRVFANATVIDARKLLRTGQFAAAIDDSDFLVVDATSANPELLDALNTAALKLNKPWLLVQGVYERSGHVGPLFYGRDTGCYRCLQQRLRSNANARDSFDRYQHWLTDNAAFSQPAAVPSDAFGYHVAAIVAAETEKFLLDYEVPQTYGYLIAIDPRNYNVQPHRLFKVPFCESCNPNFEYRRAPWLDSITLNAA